jgi:hypothetical protein
LSGDEIRFRSTRKVEGVGPMRSNHKVLPLVVGGQLTDEQIRQLVPYLRSLEPNAPSVKELPAR